MLSVTDVRSVQSQSPFVIPSRRMRGTKTFKTLGDLHARACNWYKRKARFFRGSWNLTFNSAFRRVLRFIDIGHTILLTVSHQIYSIWTIKYFVFIWSWDTTSNYLQAISSNWISFTLLFLVFHGQVDWRSINSGFWWYCYRRTGYTADSAHHATFARELMSN